MVWGCAGSYRFDMGEGFPIRSHVDARKYYEYLFFAESTSQLGPFGDDAANWTHSQWGSLLVGEDLVVRRALMHDDDDKG